MLDAYVGHGLTLHYYPLDDKLNQNTEIMNDIKNHLVIAWVANGGPERMAEKYVLQPLAAV